MSSDLLFKIDRKRIVSFRLENGCINEKKDNAEFSKMSKTKTVMIEKKNVYESVLFWSKTYDVNNKPYR